MIITLQEALEEKLKKELARQPEFSSNSFLEDVYSVLTLTEWSDDVILRFIKTPNLLREVAWRLRDDDVFSAVFEQRAIQLALEVVERQGDINATPSSI